MRGVQTVSLPLMLAALALPSGGCSLLGLDSFALPQCSTHADCAPRNAAEGILPDACELYLCDPTASVCRRVTRDLDFDGDPGPECGGSDCDDERAEVSSMAAEVCDQYDNDCDGRVDEGVLALRERRAERDLGAVESASWAWSGALVWTAPGGEAWWSSGPEPAAMSYARELDEANLMRPELDAMDVCPQLAGGALAPGRCTFAEVVTAPASGPSLFAAAIHRTGCAEGQLRLGRIDDPTDARFVLRGPPVRSNTYLGVDVDWDAGPCSGARRPTRPGATRVSIAAGSGEGPPRALAAWLGDSLARDACGGDEVDVEVMGLFEEAGRSGGADIHWVTGTNDGAPQVLGRTRGGGAPAVAGLEDAGWLVGFATPLGELALHRVAPPTSPAPVPIDAAPGDLRATPPLALAAPLYVIDTSDADAVRLAVHRVSDGWEVGVVWREGCPTGAIGMALLRLEVDPEAGAELVQRGLLTASGGGPATVAPLMNGGSADAPLWLFAWAERGTLFTQRFDNMGNLFDAMPTARPVDGTLVALAARADTGAAQVDYLLRRDDASASVGALALECGAPPMNDADAGP